MHTVCFILTFNCESSAEVQLCFRTASFQDIYLIYESFQPVLAPTTHLFSRLLLGYNPTIF